MRHLPRLIGLWAIALLVVPSLAQDAAPEVDKKLIDRALTGQFLQGKITAMDLEKKAFTIRVVVESKKTLNKEAAKRFAELNLRLKRSPNKQAYDQLLPEVKAAYDAQYDVKETIHDFKIHGSNTFQVRVDRLPPREGTDGKPKNYTVQELAKLKGSGGLPGYIADPRDLDSSVDVRAYLIRESKAKVEPPKLVVKTAGGDKPKEDMPAEGHPVSYILIMRPVDPSTTPPLGGVPTTGGQIPGGINPFIVK